MKSDWNNIRLFVAIAEAGGLTGAAVKTGVSPATLGRHINALEALVGGPLFQRSPRGYQLTELGEDLLAHAQNVSKSMSALENWSEQLNLTPKVRISAGPWKACFLAQHMNQLWQTTANYSIELVTGLERVDIGHRHAEIGVRNTRPQESWLAGRKVGIVNYALYGKANNLENIEHRYIGSSGPMATARSSLWVTQQFEDQIVIRASDSLSIRELAANGIGQAILPCFIGDHDQRLVRTSDLVSDLQTELWLVMHHEERHRPAIRKVADRLTQLLLQHQHRFAGTKKADQSPPNSLISG